jgi:LysM repeat protein
MRTATSGAIHPDMKKQPPPLFQISERQRAHLLVALATLALIGCGGISAARAQTTQAQNYYPVTTQHRATAQQTASAGVALSELAPDAPDEYTVKPRDTLWAISRLYLRSPWRWPELWGMNIDEISNPHRIYPGQTLYLDKSNGRARLSSHRSVGGIDTVKLSPHTRFDSLSDMALPTLNPSAIEPFLSEPVVVDQNTLQSVPHIVAGNDDRVLLARGDRAYARGAPGAPLVEAAGPIQSFRVFRDATPLKDPGTGEILGYEAQYLGKAQLQRGESTSTDMVDGKAVVTVVPATIDVTAAREEIRAGDRLLPEPPRQLLSYVPRAPSAPVTGGRIVSVYGNAVQFAAQNQVVAINKGTRDGIESGNVLAILKNGATIVDKTDGGKETLKLPNERIGLLMVFRPFEKVSYALVLEINDAPSIGDLLVNP